MNDLNIALQKVDLASLILEYFPDCEAKPNEVCKFLATWRGEKNKSASLFKPNGVWLWRDHAADKSGNAFNFLVDIVGLSKQEAVAKIFSFVGMSTNGTNSTISSAKREIVATYDYVDEEGKLLFQTVRFEPKSFAQRVPKGNGWEWKLGNTRRVLFNLPKVKKAILDGLWVFLVEGEKDVATLEKYGFVATCNPMGAGKWHLEYTKSLIGARLIILPDNDKSGLEHTKKVAETVHASTAELKVIHLPELKDKEDVTDWFEKGHTAKELFQIIDNTKPFKASDLEPQQPDKNSKNKETPSQIALRLFEDVELFHSSDEVGYASILVGEHIETYRLNQSGFRQFVNKTYYKSTKNILTKSTLGDVVDALEGKANFDGKTHDVFHRIARHENNIYLDLCNDAWAKVEITADGWKIINSKDCPVKFIRPKGAGALPTPQTGGSVDMLRAYIHVPDEEWLLIASFLIACLKPEGPYPILNLVAEQGSGKSTTAKILKWLVDPTTTRGRLLRTSPRDEQSIFIGARNNHVLAFDNLSGVRMWLSDALCVLSTGGSFVTRALYTDSEETVLEAVRPVILTGIGDLATRGDLLSRSLIVPLPRLTNREIVDEEILWKALDASRPQILGALLDAVVLGIKNKATLNHQPETRLADFECWAVACEDALGVEGTKFTTAYRHSRQASVEVVLSNSPLPPQITALLQRRGGIWQGTSSELLADLEEFASDRTLRQYGWPKIPNQLSKDLDRITPALREVDINVERFRGRGKLSAKLIQIKSV